MPRCDPWTNRTSCRWSASPCSAPRRSCPSRPRRRCPPPAPRFAASQPLELPRSDLHGFVGERRFTGQEAVYLHHVLAADLLHVPGLAPREVLDGVLVQEIEP